MKIAFNTANLVARVTNHRFALSQWGEQHKKTAESMNEAEWADICREIADAGYRAIEVWVAHVENLDERTASRYVKIMKDHGLTPIGLAGALTETSARICGWLGIPMANGGFWGTTPEEIKRVVESSGIAFNYENHPEKSIEEIRGKIAGVGADIGACIDTGWLGTQGVDAPAAARALGPLVRHVHLKDVKRAGGHETCPLGEGVVNIAGVIEALKEMGYTGWYSWEDEPEDRNPMDIAAEMRRWIEARVR